LNGAIEAGAFCSSHSKMAKACIEKPRSSALDGQAKPANPTG
jgi:hypothetical protein